MCPFWPLHIVVLYILALCPLWFVTCTLVPKFANEIWKVNFTPVELNAVPMYNTATVVASTTDWRNNPDVIIRALIGDSEIASVHPETLKFQKVVNSSWVAEFNVTGKFLGYTSINLCQAAIKDSTANGECLKSSNALNISVSRQKRLLDKIFTISVITLVSVIFINFGCALDIRSLKQALVRPIGPAIGLFNHFLFMPLMSYGLGVLLFPESRSALRLGLFFTGVSPAGGASNIWTYLLGGNLNLSVTMTAVSTIASLALIPLWVFTLGPVIFAGSPLGVPYQKIITSAVGLLIPLSIGYALQLYYKRFAAIMVRILKPFSAFLITFIIVFATITNFYLFRLFTWEILVGGFVLPSFGYTVGWILATLLNQNADDKLAISIETGVQNTGIAIFLLKVCLPEPDSDISTVAPVSVALMTPLPVLLLYLIRRYKKSKSSSEEKIGSVIDEQHLQL